MCRILSLTALTMVMLSAATQPASAFQEYEEKIPANNTAINGTEKESSSTKPFQQVTFPKASNGINSASQVSTKGFLGIDSASVMGVIGPLALAAIVTLPFMAPAAAALLPLAGLSSVFGRRRRHLENDNDTNPDRKVSSRQGRLYGHRKRWENFSKFGKNSYQYESERAKAELYLEKQVEKLLNRIYEALKDVDKSTHKA